MKSFFLLLLLLSADLFAQSSFPSDATILNTNELQQSLKGKVFGTKRPDGTSWLIEFTRGGNFLFSEGRANDEFVFSGDTFNASGKWVDGESKLCSYSNPADVWCMEIRTQGSKLLTIGGKRILVTWMPR